MIRSLAAAAVLTFAANLAVAADLGAKKGAPAAPVSSSCKETAESAVSSDIFGFSTGSDVSDVGGKYLQLEYNGAFGGGGFKAGDFSGHLGKIQFSTAFMPCWEIGPYLLGVT